MRKIVALGGAFPAECITFAWVAQFALLPALRINGQAVPASRATQAILQQTGNVPMRFLLIS